MASFGAVSRIRLPVFWLLALLVEAPLARMRMLSDLKHHIVETIALLLVTSIFYLFSVWLLLRKESRGHTAPSLLLILFAAIVFRVTVFPLYPAFSDDLYRYRWEGKMQLKSFNPYTTEPDDPRLAPLRDAIYPRISGKEFRGIYGPVIELGECGLYWLTSAITPDPAVQLFWFKAMAALADVGIIGAVWLLLGGRGQPDSRVLIYAWCPLPIFEFWATGHNDAVVLFFVVLAVAMAARKRDSLATVVLSFAVAAKYWPALLLPCFTGFRWRRILAAIAILFGICAVLSLPYWSDVSGNVRFTTGFLGGWRNNDSLHGVIAWLTPNPYAAKYATMASTGIAALAIAALEWSLEARVLAIVVVILALSANVHPWYVTWIVPLLALYPIPGLLLWTALAPLLYRVLIEWTILGEWKGQTPFRWFVYAPVAAVLLCDLLNRLSSRRRS